MEKLIKFNFHELFYYIRLNSLEVNLVGHGQNKSIYRALVSCQYFSNLLKLNILFHMPRMITFLYRLNKKQNWFYTDMNLESGGVFFPSGITPD